jgi:hypothetical protein
MCHTAPAGPCKIPARNLLALPTNFDVDDRSIPAHTTHNSWFIGCTRYWKHVLYRLDSIDEVFGRCHMKLRLLACLALRATTPQPLRASDLKVCVFCLSMWCSNEGLLRFGRHALYRIG